ncbi:MAG: 3-dehydroquinate synthase [Eubacteriales bacterium]|nr:3-dehydroquinate synthase [Eubacteriales bacterium]
MLEELLVRDTESTYSIYIDDSYDDLNRILREHYSSDIKICVITDTNVGRIYLNDMTERLQNDFPNVHSFVFPAGEAAKRMDTVLSIYRFLLDRHFNRKDIIIALGGGVVGDMAGFAAATYMRGIDYIQLPTSLLAQVDSSIGGKTGIDLDGYKNIVGAFKKPAFVYANVHVLRTLEQRQYYNGMGEVLKHGFILDADYLNYIERRAKDIEMLHEQAVARMVVGSCRIKQSIVARDFRESSVRALLNFGHTIGHAVEKYAYRDLCHGECVAIGMMAAAHIALQRKMIDDWYFHRMHSLLSRFQLPARIPADIIQYLNAGMILDAVLSDKKADTAGIKWILPDGIGKAVILNDVTSGEVEEAVLYALGQ